MNAAHFHMMVNHLPIMGLGFAILFHLVALLIKNAELTKISWWFYILVGLLSILPIATGDGSREILLTYPGISKNAIDYHETMAYIFFYGLITNGALSLGTLWFSRKKPDFLKKFNLAILIIALITFVFAFQTGLTAGKIRHPEIEQGIYKK